MESTTRLSVRRKFAILWENGWESGDKSGEEVATRHQINMLVTLYRKETRPITVDDKVRLLELAPKTTLINK